jgi:TPR repeat protein
MRWTCELASLCAVSLAAVAGAAIEPLPHGAPAALAPGEGFVVVVFDVLQDVSSVRFVDPRQRSRAFGIKVVGEGVSGHAFKVPAGRYCLDTLRVGRARLQRERDSALGCFEVAAGALTYPGHFAPRGGDGPPAESLDQPLPEVELRIVRQPRAALGVVPELKPREFVQRLRAEQPALFARFAEYRDGRDPDVASRVARQLEYVVAAASLSEPDLMARFAEEAVAIGGTDAMRRVGDLHRNGPGVRIDPAEALAWYQRAADAGDAAGAGQACDLLLSGERGGVDAVSARPQCERGVAGGDPLAAVLLARMHREALAGLAPDPAREYALVSGAATRGLASAQRQAGIALREGRGAERDLVAAAKLFELAAAQKDGDAQVALADALVEGAGLVADPARAATLYEAAGRAGRTTAWLPLARLNANGVGVPKDLDKAGRLFDRVGRVDHDGAIEQAWFLATCESEKVRDGKRALATVEYVIRRRGASRPLDLAVLAAARAEQGDFVGALADLDRALDLLPKDATVRREAWLAQRAAYADGRAWRVLTYAPL